MNREASPIGTGRAQVLGLDALVAVVAPGNPVTALRLDDLKGIFTGRIANWRELGGPDVAITAYARPDGTASAALLRARITDGPIGAGVKRLPGDKAIADAVAADPFAIGLTGYAHRGSARALGLTGECGYPIWPSDAALKAGDYPLTVRLLAYRPARRLPRLGRSLLSFLSSEAAQALLPRAGFVGQDIVTLPFAAEGPRLAHAIASAGRDVGLAELQRMVAELDGARRLSAGFRFDGGASGLDAGSRVNVDLLARRLAAGGFDGQELIFSGFSDADGPAALNRRLSLERAEAVRRALAAALDGTALNRLAMRSVGFGELSPLACDDTGWGRRVNRRVEIWVRPQR